MQTFSFNPPINLVEEGKWFMAVSSFECTISVFNITNENNSFSITTSGHWNSESAQQTIDKLKEQLELDKRDLSLHTAAVREKGHKKEIGEDEYDLSDLDNSLLRNEIFEKLKNIYIMGSPTRLQNWMAIQGVSVLSSIKMNKVPTSISTRVHSVCLLVLPIVHPANMKVSKIWSIENN